MLAIVTLPQGADITTNELSPMFGHVKRSFVHAECVQRISIVGEGDSECVRIRYSNGDSDEISYQYVDSFDGQPVPSNEALYLKLCACLAGS